MDELTTIIGAAATVILIIIALAIADFICFILLLMKILKAKNPSDWKLLWIATIFFFGPIGILLFFLVGKKQLIQEETKT